MEEQYSNIFYFKNINKIGGVETFFYEIAKKYYNYDITVFYQNGDEKQLARLRELVRVKKWNKKEKIKCKKAFLSYYSADIIDNINAKEYYGLVHADFEHMPAGYLPFTHPKITKYLGVSQTVCDAFTRITGLPCELCYNPFTPPIKIRERKKIRLVSATRLAKEKGKWRILELIRLFDLFCIPFEWTIFTTDTNVIEHPNVIYKEPELDIYGYLKEADYVVQLSDTEAYCYTMIEALSLGTPIIVCDWPVLKELHIDERHGFILPLDMKNIPIQDIYNKKFNFKYEPPKDRWNEFLDNKPSKYLEELSYKYEVEALDTYKEEGRKDGQLDKIPNAGDRWIVSKPRLDVLLGQNKFKKQYVKLIRKIKEEQ